MDTTHETSQVRQRQRRDICTCTHPAPDEDHFCTVGEQTELALDYQSLARSNPGRVGWVEDELNLYHAGTLLDFNDEEIDLLRIVGRDEFGEEITLIDQVFGACPASAMKRLIARAGNTRVNTLDADPDLRMRHLLFYHAMQVHRCRTQGRCSSASNTTE